MKLVPAGYQPSGMLTEPLGSGVTARSYSVSQFQVRVVVLVMLKLTAFELPRVGAEPVPAQPLQTCCVPMPPMAPDKPGKLYWTAWRAAANGPAETAASARKTP